MASYETVLQRQKGRSTAGFGNQTEVGLQTLESCSHLAGQGEILLPSGTQLSLSKGAGADTPLSLQARAHPPSC